MGGFWRIFTAVLVVAGGVVGEKVSKNPTDTITSGGMLISFLTTRERRGIGS